jgi:hypothetical protein
LIEQWIDWDSDGTFELADVWTFSLSAGGKMLMDLASASFDPTLIVFRPDGSGIVDSNGGGGTNASLLFDVNQSGTWVVFVTSPVAATGGYSLSVLADANPIVPNALVQFDYTYDKVGNVLTAVESSSVATGLGATTTNIYDSLNRLIQTKQSVGGTVNKRANYAYLSSGGSKAATSGRNWAAGVKVS